MSRWEDACRPGQRGAVRTILDQYLAGAKFTPIILPTRYGKSDVMRLATILLWQNNHLPCALALSPNVLLRDQLNNSDKWKDAAKRYGLKLDKQFRKRTLDSFEPGFTANGEVFVSATIQMIDRQVTVFFVDWVRHVIDSTGHRPIIFIDECHTGSDDNSWGETTKLLADAGAHVVLLTATAMRSDGNRIPGFDFEESTESPTTVSVVKPGSLPELVRVDIYAGIRRRLRLLAKPPTGWETTFRDAWLEDPQPLCKISRVPFDIDLDTITGRSTERRLLSEVTSESEARRILGKLVRDQHVIQAGVERLVNELRNLRKVFPKVQAIVFSGNDTEIEDERSVNKHANAIRAAIERTGPEFVTVIATSATGAGVSQIQAFDKGRGDILIVKQMASLGLDIPTLKVALDLSSVRTPAAFIQRLMRVATPCGDLRLCTYVAPDDVVGRALFEGLVRNSMGSAVATDLELVQSYEKQRDEASDKTIYSINGTENAAFEDSIFNKANPEAYPTTQTIIASFPILLQYYSHAEIAIQATKFSIGSGEQPTRIVDTGDQIRAVRTNITTMATDIANQRIARTGYKPDEYSAVIQGVWVEAYRAVGIQVGIHLDKISDLAVLQRLKAKFEEMRARATPETRFEFVGEA